MSTDIERTWDLFAVPGYCLELRALLKEYTYHAYWGNQSAEVVVGYFDNKEKFVEWAQKLDALPTVEGIYVCPNPADVSLLARANNRLIKAKKGGALKDELVVERRWIHIDIDPVRPSGISSSDDELKLCADVAKRMSAWLAEQGIYFVMAASGNGIHGFVNIPMPNDDYHTGLAKGFLARLSEEFTTGKVKIDTDTASISRGAKVYGTVTRKGDSINGRPHRRSSIISIPDNLQPVTVEMLEKLQPLAPAKSAPESNGASGDTTSYWTPEKLLGEYLAKSDNGHRNAVGFDLACALRDQGYDMDTAKDTLLRYAQRVPDAGNGYTTSEAIASVGQAYAKSAREPRKSRREKQEAEDDGDDVPTPEEIEEVLGIRIASGDSEDEGEEVLGIRIASGDSEDEGDDDAPAATRYKFPYLIDDQNRTLFLIKTGKGMKMQAVADFSVAISKQIEEEDGKLFFVLDGKTRTGREFSIEVPAETIGNDRKLMGILEATSGAHDGVAAGMAKHLGPAIKALTGDVEYGKRFHRVGWHNGRFLVPGRSNGDIEVCVTKPPFSFGEHDDVGVAMDTLRYLLAAHPLQKTTVMLSYLLAAPLAHWAGWRSKRHGMFIQGRTNSFKTSWTQTAMCIYGEEYADESKLLRLGEGATNYALMEHAIMASDIPLFVDNYKPNTGKGAGGFVNLIHAMIEGGEKERMDGRSMSLRTTRPIYTWPLFTGESVPDNDAASLTRLIIIELEKDKASIQHLTKAQSWSEYLPQVGRMWIEWLESAEGQSVAREVGETLNDVRRYWLDRLHSYGNSTGFGRIATNISVNAITWQAALRHPVLGPVLAEYSEDHDVGLHRTAKLMCDSASQSIEAEVFLNTLSQLISSGRCILIEPQLEVGIAWVDRMVGWQDSGGVYLLPDIAINSVLRVIGYNGLNNISRQTLYNQLESLGFLLKGGDRSTKPRNFGGKQHRVLHLRPGSLEGETKEYEEEIEEEMVLGI